MRKLDYPFEDYKSALSKTMRTAMDGNGCFFLLHCPRANGICGQSLQRGANSGGAVAYASSLLLKLLKTLIESQTRWPGAQCAPSTKPKTKHNKSALEQRQRTRAERSQRELCVLFCLVFFRASRKGQQ